MQDYVADTHSLIWYLEDSPRLSPAARKCFDDCDSGESTIHVPTICMVGIIYLQEKGRIPDQMKQLLDEELRSGYARVLSWPTYRPKWSRCSRESLETLFRICLIESSPPLPFISDCR